MSSRRSGARPLICLLASSAMIAAIELGAKSAQAAANPAASKESFESIVREYIINHPEVIEEALRLGEIRRDAQEKERARQSILAAREELLSDPATPVAGNPTGTVSVVEFFDYSCPHCKRVAGSVRALVQGNASVRLIYKEFPILGPQSVLAARAALAAHAQGRYVAFHEGLMAAPGPPTLESILGIAAKMGLDGARLKMDMESPAIRDAIKRNLQLADKLGIQGTPTFVAGKELVPGELGYHDLEALVERARGE